MQKQFELLEVRVIEGSSYRDFTVCPFSILYLLLTSFILILI